MSHPFVHSRRYHRMCRVLGAVPLDEVVRNEDGLRDRRKPYKKILAVGLSCLALLCIAGFFTAETQDPQFASNTASSTQALWTDFLDNGTLPHDMVKLMDSSIDPCVDFHAFSCGGFEKTAHMQPDQVEWSPSWDVVEQKIAHTLRQRLQTDTGRAGTFYRSCMDTTTIEALGAQPLLPWMALSDSVVSNVTLVEAIGKLQQVNIPVFFDWQVMADPTDPTRYALGLIDGGTTLPQPKYYTSTEPRFVKHRAAYLKIVQHVLELSGLTQPEAIARAPMVVEVETALAHATLPQDELRRAPAYHLDMNDLMQLAPGLDFIRIFGIMGDSTVGADKKDLLCKDPEYLQIVSKLLMGASTSEFAKLRAYLRFRAAFTMGSDLSDDFLQVGFDLGKELTGVLSRVPREKKCYDGTKANMPDDLAKLFVEHHFPASSKEAAATMLAHIRSAFHADLSTVPWLEPATRKLAIEKLANMFFAVGHGSWQNYDFEVKPHAYLNNTNNAKIWEIRKALERMRKHVERERWGSTDPTQADAFYGRQVNGLFVPAGVLQAPFFSPVYPLARNYGSVGCLMGHEMTHGFDDVGRKYDMFAREHNWWTSLDVSNFRSRAECIAELYSSFEVDGAHVKGNQTLPEDIADMGGVKLSHAAFMSAASSVPHRSDEQLFFLSWGQTWCSIEREKTERMSVLTDEHAPDKFRVNGVLSQFQPFAEAFGCPAGAPMNPPSRCELW